MRLKKKLAAGRQVFNALSKIGMLVLCASMLQKQAYAYFDNPTCLQGAFPLAVGGSRDEEVNCFVYHEASEQLIVGGITQSDDFAGSLSETGFLYAVSLTGDITWSNYYQLIKNQSLKISGCKLSDDGKDLVVMGQSENSVDIMLLDPANGKVKNLYKLSLTELEEDELLDIQTFGAIHYDKIDPNDGKSYIYASFLLNNRIQLVKMEQSVPDRKNEFPQLAWHFDFTDLYPDISEYTFGKQPQFIFTQPAEPDMIYLGLRYNGEGNIIKFQKRNGLLRWRNQVKSMTRLNAYATSKLDSGSTSDHIYVCGSNNSNDRKISAKVQERQEEAWVVRMDSQGTTDWLLKLAGSSTGKGVLPSDSCTGIVFEESQEVLIALVQTKSKEMRNQQTKGNWFDSTLIFISPNGDILKGISISNRGEGNDILSSTQSLILANKHLYMAGMSYGFQTEYQSSSQEVRNKDTFLHRFLLPNNFLDIQPEYDIGQNICPNAVIIDPRRISSATERFGRIAGLEIVNHLTQEPQDLPRAQNGHKYFQVEYSKFVTTKATSSGFKSPRPCAYRSVQLTENPVEYFRGAKALKYKVEDSPFADLLYFIQSDKEGQNRTVLVDQNGKTNSPYFNFTANNGGEISFYTDSVSDVGKRTISVKHCDAMNRFVELNLPINVVPNTQPVFRKEPQTVLTMKVNETLEYNFPDIQDFELNANPVILVEPFTGSEQYYPYSIMHLLNDNKTLVFDPQNNLQFDSKTFFFKVTLKEEGILTRGRQYFFQLIVGDLAKNIANGSNDPYRKKQEDFRMSYDFMEIYTSTNHGATTVKFTKPVDMDVLERDFESIFTPSLRSLNQDRQDVGYVPLQLKSFVVSEYNHANQSLSVQFEVENPSIVGLNLRKSDKLVLKLNESYPMLDLFTNMTQRELNKLKISTEAWGRVELYFDRSNERMENFWIYTKAFVVIFIVIALIKLVLSIYFGLSLLTFWSMIEYAQLIAIIPLHTSRYLPWVYDIFKPFLVTHQMYYINSAMFSKEESKIFYNLQFKAYGLPADIFVNQTAFNWAIVLFALFLIDFVTVLLIQKFEKDQLALKYPKINYTLEVLNKEFRFNAYVRYLQLVYLDAVFISSVNLFNPQNEQADIFSTRVMISMLVLAIMILLPFFVLTFFCSSFHKLSQDKDLKKKFSTILLKVDKEHRNRILLPCLFFLRRLVTAVILVLSTQHLIGPAYQYSMIVTMSALTLLYLMITEPYATRPLNIYITCQEIIFFLLLVSAFIFTDASSDVEVKNVVAFLVLALLVTFLGLNICQTIYILVNGKDKMKQKYRDAKQARKQKALRQFKERQRKKLKGDMMKRNHEKRLEKEKLEKLQEKIKSMREEGKSNDEIEDFLINEEMKQKTGFTMKGGVGPRLVTMGALSSSSDDEHAEYLDESLDQAIKSSQNGDDHQQINFQDEVEMQRIREELIRQILEQEEDSIEREKADARQRNSNAPYSQDGLQDKQPFQRARERMYGSHPVDTQGMRMETDIPMMTINEEVFDDQGGSSLLSQSETPSHHEDRIDSSMKNDKDNSSLRKRVRYRASKNYDEDSYEEQYMHGPPQTDRSNFQDEQDVSGGITRRRLIDPDGDQMYQDQDEALAFQIVKQEQNRGKMQFSGQSGSNTGSQSSSGNGRSSSTSNQQVSSSNQNSSYSSSSGTNSNSQSSETSNSQVSSSNSSSVQNSKARGLNQDKSQTHGRMQEASESLDFRQYADKAPRRSGTQRNMQGVGEASKSNQGKSSHRRRATYMEVTK